MSQRVFSPPWGRKLSVILRDRFKMNFYSNRLQMGVCFVAFLGHISEDMPCETRRAYAPFRSVFMTNFIMKRSLIKSKQKQGPKKFIALKKYLRSVENNEKRPL